MSREERIRASFARQALMATLGAELVSVGDGACRIVAPILPGARQQHGYAHAGLTFAIGDSASGYAALSMMPEDHEVMTAEMKINLLAPGTGERLTAEGRVVRPGRRLFVVTAEVTDSFDGAFLYQVTWAEVVSDRRGTLARGQAVERLEQAEEAGTLVVNRPQALRDVNEKLYTAWFPEFVPRTVITLIGSFDWTVARALPA